MIRGFGFALAAGLVGVELLACSNDPDRCESRSQLHAGSIQIGESPGAARLGDLECVEVVTGNLTIVGKNVETLEPLRSLVHVMGDVKLVGLNLTSLHGLERLEEIDGSLSLSTLPRLESLQGLENLATLKGGLDLSGLPQLRSVVALAHLAEIGGDFSLAGLTSLQTLEGLGVLARIGGDFDVAGNDALTELSALSGLRRIEGDFHLYVNPALISASLGSASLGSDYEYGWPMLGGPTVGGSITVDINDALETLVGFGVQRPGNYQCPGTRDSGDGLISADSNRINIGHNANLQSLVLPAVSGAAINVSNNSRLVAISALEDYGRPCLMSLVDLPSLTSVNLGNWGMNALQLQNVGLTTLDGFQNTSLTCSLYISDNPALVDMHALSTNSHLAATFHVSDNPRLPMCQAQAVANALPTTSEQCVISGTLTAGTRSVTISGNDAAASCE